MLEMTTVPDNPNAEYREEKRLFEIAEDAAERLIGVVMQGARHLAKDGWQHTQISNDPVGGFFPAEAMVGGGTINGKEWPSAESLSTALHSYHDAKNAMNQAFKRIPADEREEMQPPPE